MTSFYAGYDCATLLLFRENIFFSVSPFEQFYYHEFLYILHELQVYWIGRAALMILEAMLSGTSLPFVWSSKAN